MGKEDKEQDTERCRKDEALLMLNMATATATAYRNIQI